MSGGKPSVSVSLYNFFFMEYHLGTKQFAPRPFLEQNTSLRDFSGYNLFCSKTFLSNKYHTKDMLHKKIFTRSSIFQDKGLGANQVAHRKALAKAGCNQKSLGNWSFSTEKGLRANQLCPEIILDKRVVSRTFSIFFYDRHHTQKQIRKGCHEMVSTGDTTITHDRMPSLN